MWVTGTSGGSPRPNDCAASRSVAIGFVMLRATASAAMSPIAIESTMPPPYASSDPYTLWVMAAGEMPTATTHPKEGSREYAV